MKSPVIEIEYQVVEKTVEVPTFVYARVSHNCVLPEAASRKEILYADGLIKHLIGEYKLKYEACLNSLEYENDRTSDKDKGQ